MTPLDFARALADLMRPRVISAQRYLDEHRDLEQLGMPIEIARHALDRPPQDTGPWRAVQAWDEKGLLGLHGALNNGKTHAAALWARRRRSEGRRVVWISCPGLLSFEAMDRAFARAGSAAAVVLDDLGPGLGGTDGFRTKIAALIQERAHRPTLITANANTGQLELYIGARVVSRLQQAGTLKHFASETGLREADPERLDDDGRGKRWQAATWMVWRLGCEPDDSFDGTRVVHGYRVGDALEASRLDLAGLRALAMRFGLTIEAVEARAAEAQASADRARGLMDEWTPPPMKTAAKMAEIIERSRGDVELARAYLDQPKRGSPSAPALHSPREWAGKVELRQLGFEVTRKRPGTRELASTFRVLYQGKIKHAGIRTEADGWRIAAGLIDGETARPGSASSPDYYQRTQAIRDAALARRGER